MGSYAVRYPLGAMVSWVMQYLRGFVGLGHEVWFVERADYPDACFDPRRNVMTDDAATGVEVISRGLAQIGLADRWCFADYSGTFWGTERRSIEEVLRTADVFIDMGTHGAWLDEVRRGGALCVLLDGEPGYTQIKLEQRRRSGEDVDVYDRYFTNGWNVGTDRSSAPTAGLDWGHLPHPVDTSAVLPAEPSPTGPVVALMNWQGHDPVVWDGRSFGQKDVEFPRFLGLPRATSQPLELAVAGRGIPWEALLAHGWRLRNPHDATSSLAAFDDYVRTSLAEFAVCKNVFVALRTGWFSDRSAYFLAKGRAVVMQDTGFSEHLPVGEGLFAIDDVDGAARAIDSIRSDPVRHGRTAREIACDVLDAQVLLARLLGELGA